MSGIIRGSYNHDLDLMAKQYFPVTLGAAYKELAPAPVKPSTFRNAPTGIRRPDPSPWKPDRSRSRKHKRSKSAPSATSVEKMYLMTSQAPSTGSSTVLLSSPYQSELGRLRMERLKIEEQHLLETVRQEELEKLRGPKPKWYEMKSPEFHYEAHKNNELIQSRKSWQELLDYRNQLTEDSKRYQQLLTSMGTSQQYQPALYSSEGTSKYQPSLYMTGGATYPNIDTRVY